MFGVLGFAIALLGSSLAGFYDLRTTEIPDWNSLSMIFLGLGLNLFRSLWTSNPVYFFQSASVGTAFFVFGFLMYMGGQWGGGDAKILTGVGTLLPSLPAFAPAETLLPFPFSIFVNLFFVGTVYIVVYAFSYAFFNEDIVRQFVNLLKKEKKSLLVFLLVISLLSILPSFVFPGRFSLLFLLLIPAALAIFLLGKFLKIVEDVGFIREVDSEELEAGDMLAEENPVVDSDVDYEEEMKESSSVFSFFILLPATMYTFSYIQGFYFALAVFSGLFGLGLLSFYFLVYKTDLLSEFSIFKSSSTRIRGLTAEEAQAVSEDQETVKVRSGVRFAPAFPLAILFTIYLGDFFFLFI